MEREASKSFEDLVVWQKAHRFVLAICDYIATFPKQEMYGLVSQLRCAALLSQFQQTLQKDLKNADVQIKYDL